jgi:hypothetical protein
MYKFLNGALLGPSPIDALPEPDEPGVSEECDGDENLLPSRRWKIRTRF